MKSYLDDAIGVVPPSSVDVDQLIARRRRRSAYQRVGLTAGGLAAVAALVVGAAALNAGSGDGATDAPGLRPAGSANGDSASHVTTRVRAGVARLAPGLSWVEPYEAVDGIAKGTSTVFSSDWGDLGDATGTGAIYVAVYPAGTSKGVPAKTDMIYHCQADEAQCAVSTGSSGERVLRRTSDLGDGVTARYVGITRTDGAVIILEATNYTRGSGSTRPASRATPVLSLDQLVAIGATL